MLPGGADARRGGAPQDLPRPARPPAHPLAPLSRFAPCTCAPKAQTRLCDIFRLSAPKAPSLLLSPARLLNPHATLAASRPHAPQAQTLLCALFRLSALAS